jgi:hypothetical protein
VEKKQRVRWLRPRFSLWAMLVLVTVVAIPLSYVAQRRGWNLRRAAAYKALSDKDLSLRMLPAPVSTAGPPTVTVFQRWWNAIMKDDLVPVITRVSLQDKDGVQGPLPSPTDEDLQLFAIFPEIVEFKIAHAGEVSDEGMKAIARLPNLRTLEVQSMANVNGVFLSELPDNSKLQSLSFDWMPALEGEGFANINKLSELKMFRLFMCPKLTDASLDDASLPSQIEYLSLAELHLGDATVSRWLSQVNLKTLTLNTDVSRKIAPALAKQTRLTSLSIYNAPLVDEDIEFLGRCAGLEQLLLHGMPIRGDFLKQITDPSKLIYLQLNHTLLTDENAGELRRFAKLQTLNLQFTPISGECFANVSTWPAYISLNLIGTEFSERGKEALARISGPQRIELPGNWDWNDFRRAPEGKLPYVWSVSSKMSDTMERPRDVLPALTLFSTYEPSGSISRIDRSPADLMKPVLRLHRLAKADKE